MEDGRLGCWGGIRAACACAQLHMPRRRKSTSPPRHSGASGSPSAAERRVSYRDAVGTESIDSAMHASAVVRLTEEFFFHPTPARSSWGAHPDRIPGEPGSPIRVLGTAGRVRCAA